MSAMSRQRTLIEVANVGVDHLASTADITACCTKNIGYASFPKYLIQREHHCAADSIYLPICVSTMNHTMPLRVGYISCDNGANCLNGSGIKVINRARTPKIVRLIFDVNKAGYCESSIPK